MVHVNRLLCILSQPSSSSASFRQALHLAASLGATVHVMSLEKEPPNALDEALQEQTDRFGTPIDLRIGPSLGNTSPATRPIRQYVEAEDIDLVIVDTPKDRGPIPPLADPSTQTLLEQLDCPVFVAGGPEAGPDSVRRILVPTDFSEHSLVAFRHATGLASLYDATVVLLHVVDANPYIALTQKDQLSLSGTSLPERRARRRLRSLVQKEQGGEVSIDSHLTFGDPADQVVHVTTQQEVDLLVLSTHGTRTHPHHPLGQVADRILRRATGPLFLARAFGKSLLRPKATSEES